MCVNLNGLAFANVSRARLLSSFGHLPPSLAVVCEFLYFYFVLYLISGLGRGGKRRTLHHLVLHATVCCAAAYPLRYCSYSVISPPRLSYSLKANVLQYLSSVPCHFFDWNLVLSAICFCCFCVSHLNARISHFVPICYVSESIFLFFFLIPILSAFFYYFYSSV